MCDFLTLHPYYIYPHYPQIVKRPFREENPKQVFYNTHTHPSFRDSYSSLVRNHCSLFSFPLPLSYLERRFVHKYNPHIFRVFWSLGSFEELPKETGETWRMQLGVLQDSKSQTRHSFEKPCWSRSLKGLNASGRLGLEGLLLTHVSQLIVQWSNYQLEDGGKVLCRVLQFPL